MRFSDYLQLQSERCFRLARECVHLSVAEQLRLMGEEFRAKASELERQQRPTPAPRHSSN